MNNKDRISQYLESALGLSINISNPQKFREKLRDAITELNKTESIEDVEEWRKHPTIDIECSTLGRIRDSKRIRKTPINGGGYASIGINGKSLKVHRLIAETFIPNPENKTDVNHINSIRNDNKATNLEWCTRSENIQHAYDIGRMKAPKTAYKPRRIKDLTTGKEYPSAWQAKKDTKCTGVIPSAKQNKEVTSRTTGKTHLFAYI